MRIPSSVHHLPPFFAMFEVHLTTGLPIIVFLTLCVFLLPLLLLHHSLNRSIEPCLPSRPPSIHTTLSPIHRDTFTCLRAFHRPNLHLVLPTHSTILIGDPWTLKDILESPCSFPVGVLHVSSASMWRLSPTCAAWFAGFGGQVTINFLARLFSGSKLTLLQDRFVAALSSHFDSVQNGVDDVHRLVSRLVFQSTMEALFSSTFPKGLYEEFGLWDGELQEFCSASPSARAVQARDRFYDTVAEQLADRLEECSPQVKELFEAVQDQHGQSHADAVAVVLRTAWLGATQTPLAAGWLACSLAHHLEKMSKVREEVCELMERIGLETVEDLAKKPELLKELPLLDRLVKELLRLYCKPSVPRVCVKDMVVRAMDGNGVKKVQLKQGDMLQLVYWNAQECEYSSQVSLDHSTISLTKVC